MSKRKEIIIKSSTYYFFNYMINVKNVDPNRFKIFDPYRLKIHTKISLFITLGILL